MLFCYEVIRNAGLTLDILLNAKISGDLIIICPSETAPAYLIRSANFVITQRDIT